MTDVDEPIRPPARLRASASWQANKVANLGARLTAARMPPGGRVDFAVLAALEEYGPLSQADLGRRLGLDRNDVNAVLNRLQSQHHVDRQPDPADGRRNVVTMTPAGEEQLAELQRHADAVQQELLRGLDAGDRRRLQALLAQVLQAHPTQPV